MSEEQQPFIEDYPEPDLDDDEIAPELRAYIKYHAQKIARREIKQAMSTMMHHDESEKPSVQAESESPLQKFRRELEEGSEKGNLNRKTRSSVRYKSS